MKTKGTILGRKGIISLLVIVFAFTFIFSGIANSIELQFHDVNKLRLSPKILQLVKNKRPISAQTLALYRVHEGKFLFRVAPDHEVQLMAPDFTVYTPVINPNLVKFKLCGTVIDHRAKQTPIKNQGSRNTCVAHASMAGLEVSYGSTTLDLSDNYAYYKFLGSSTANVCADPGLKTIDAADLMTTNKMGAESCWPYVSTLSGLGCPTPSGWPTAACASSASYQLSSHVKILRNDALTTDEGNYINNPKYLESILCQGYDIVAGFHVAGWPSGATGIIDVTSGAPIVGGHAMVIVGYNRNGDANIGGGYFILKNSWGTGKGQSGYVYLSYDYIRTYAKYGFYITGVVKKPDLTVSITGPKTAKRGQSLGKNIVVKLTNKGNAAATNVMIDLVLSSNNVIPVQTAVYNANYSDDVLLQGGREFVSSIAAGATINVTLNGNNKIPANTPIGTHFLGVVADGGKAIAELDETNNTASTPIIIQ